MPFSIGWSELLVVGVIALIVIGPKDLPIVFRKLGQWVGQMRAMAREFQYAMNEAAEQSGLNEAKTQIKNATSLEGTGLDDLRDTIEDYQNDINSINPLSDLDDSGPKAPKKKAGKKKADKKTTQRKSAPKMAAKKKPNAAGAKKPAAKSKSKT